MKQKNVGTVLQMVTADWLVLLHTIPWAKRWFALALASKSHFKKSCHGSTGSTHSKGGGLLCAALLQHHNKHLQHLVPAGRRG